jgi:hypothetical protein
MKISVSRYKRHRFPLQIIQHVIWLSYRFKQLETSSQQTACTAKRQKATQRVAFSYLILGREPSEKKSYLCYWSAG